MEGRFKRIELGQVDAMPLHIGVGTEKVLSFREDSHRSKNGVVELTFSVISYCTERNIDAINDSLLLYYRLFGRPRRDVGLCKGAVEESSCEPGLRASIARQAKQTGTIIC